MIDADQEFARNVASLRNADHEFARNVVSLRNADQSFGGGGWCTQTMVQVQLRAPGQEVPHLQERLVPRGHIAHHESFWFLLQLGCVRVRACACVCVCVCTCTCTRARMWFSSNFTLVGLFSHHMRRVLFVRLKACVLRRSEVLFCLAWPR
jgi:hypothetical protein